MKKYWILNWCFLVITITCSCNKNESEETVYLDANGFYPLRIGSFIVYDVVDTLYNLGNVKLANSYQLKIRVGGVLADTSVKRKYSLERFKRNTFNDQWVLDSIWVVSVTKENEFVNWDGANPTVRMVSPLRTGLVWNGNKYNNRDSEIYKLRSIQKPYYLSDTIFSNTIKIVQNETFHYRLGYASKYDIYAKDLGLVYKYHHEYRYMQKDTTVIKDDIVGLFREYKYNTNGIE